MGDLDDETLEKAIEAQVILLKLQRHMYDRSVELLAQKCSPEGQDQ